MIQNCINFHADIVNDIDVSTVNSIDICIVGHF